MQLIYWIIFSIYLKKRFDELHPRGQNPNAEQIENAKIMRETIQYKLPLCSFKMLSERLMPPAFCFKRRIMDSRGAI
jgi:hypothetical protein